MIQDHRFLGGAARAANRWSDFLETEGFTIQRMAGDQAEGKGLVLTGKPPRGWARLYEHFTDRRSARKTKVDQCLENTLQKEKPDLIWIHNIAGGGKWGWSEDMISIARQHAPVLWTLHDMWALGMDEQSYWEVSTVVEGEGEQSAKAEGFQGSRVERVCGGSGKYRVTLTAPSRWLAELTIKITGCSCVFLPNPINLNSFSPGDRRAARRKLGLPEKGLVVLAGADSLKDRRKGFDLLREAWKSGSFHDATLALFGRHGESRPGEQYLGNLNSDEELVAAYRAADLYVHPARMENAPCTIQESLACGTPVVAFAVGGIPEMIRPGETGFLAESVNSTSLATTLGKALETPQRLAQMVSACRKYAEKDFDLATQVANLFQMSLGFSR
jgi:glycosyltransferase involved in cell wall biosynthesis